MKVYNKININYLWLYFVAILLVIMWAIIPIITILKTENDALISSGIFWFILLFAICYALVTMAISNYLIVKDDCAIVKNFFCPFLKFVFYYKDVDKIEVWSRPGSGVYLKIFRKGLPLRQMPLMIRNKYADELFDFWKSRGIHAEPGDWSTIRGIIHTKKTKAEVRNHEVVSIYGRRIIKVYKKSVFRVFMFWVCISMYIFPFGIAYLITKRFSLPVAAYFLLFMIVLFAILAIAFNYLIFMDDHFIIRNGFYPFWKRRFYYKDIRLIEMRHTPRGGPFLKIFTHNGSVSQIPIELVMKTDLYEISELWKAQGVQVEIKSRAIEGIIEKAKKKSE